MKGHQESIALSTDLIAVVLHHQASHQLVMEFNCLQQATSCYGALLGSRVVVKHKVTRAEDLILVGQAEYDQARQTNMCSAHIVMIWHGLASTAPGPHAEHAIAQHQGMLSGMLPGMWPTIIIDALSFSQSSVLPSTSVQTNVSGWPSAAHMHYQDL